MTDIKNILDDLELSVHGSEIKNLIVDALKKLKDGGGAESLDGTRFDDYVTVQEFMEVTPLLQHIEEDSDKGVESQAVYSYIKSIKNHIDTMLLKETPDINDPVMVKLKNVSDIINEIYNAIITKSPSTHGSFLFRNSPIEDYPTAIENMSLETEDPGYKTLEVDKNGTWPENGEDDIYSSVSVNVSKNLTANKTINQLDSDGTYKLTPGNGTNGYKKVSIDISGQLKNLSLTPSNILNDSGSPADLGNETGSVTPNDNGETLGYKEVSIDITDKFKDLSVEINNEFVEQTFEAKDGDGLENSEPAYGYKSFTVNFDTESKTEFTVTFHAKTDISVNVEKHGYAAFPGDEDDIPEKNGYRFSDWNPKPIDVTRDMDCYPEYEPETKDPLASGEASETWEEISKNGGVNVKVGEWKWIYAARCEFKYADRARGETLTVRIPPMAYRVYKVASNYCGASSAWFTAEGIPGTFTWMHDNPTLFDDPDQVGTGWKKCDFNEWLNTEYINAIGTLSNKEPYNSCGSLVSAIKTMNMPYAANEGMTEVSKCKLWLPSATECGVTGYEDSEAGCLNLGLSSPVTRTMYGNRWEDTVVSMGYQNVNGQQKEIKGLSHGPTNYGGSGWAEPTSPTTESWSDALRDLPSGSVFWATYDVVNSGGGYHPAYCAFPGGIPSALEGTESGRNPFVITSYMFSNPRFGFGT